MTHKYEMLYHMYVLSSAYIEAYRGSHNITLILHHFLHSHWEEWFWFCWIALKSYYDMLVIKILSNKSMHLGFNVFHYLFLMNTSFRVIVRRWTFLLIKREIEIILKDIQELDFHNFTMVIKSEWKGSLSVEIN